MVFVFAVELPRQKRVELRWEQSLLRAVQREEPVAEVPRRVVVLAMAAVPPVVRGEAAFALEAVAVRNSALAEASEQRERT